MKLPSNKLYLSFVVFQKTFKQTILLKKMKKILCKINLHKWNRPTYIDYGPSSNVKNWKKICQRCGKVKTWVEAKK